MKLRPSVGELLEQLKREDLLPPEGEARALPVLGRVEVPLPWYVRALSGLGGWAAALFAIGFVFFLDPGRDAFTVLGFSALFGAVLLRRRFETPFTNQLALALALTGEVAALHGLRGSVSGSDLALTALAIEVTLVAAYPDALMRFLATCCAFVAGLEYVHDVTYSNELTWPIVVALLGAFGLLWQRPALERTRVRAVVLPVAYGLAACAFVALVAGLERPWSTPYVSGETTWLVAAVVGGFAWVMLAESKARPREWAVALGAVAVLAVCFRNPGILAAVGLLAAGFWRRETKLIAMASAFLLWFGSAFYYHLGATLLVKSGALLGAGLMFLALRFYVERTARKTAEVTA